MPATSAEPRGSLVVGGGKGIGRAICAALAERGDDTGHVLVFDGGWLA